jgi:hypothetical protein
MGEKVKNVFATQPLQRLNFSQESLQICDLLNSALGGGGELVAGEVGPEQENKRRGGANVS